MAFTKITAAGIGSTETVTLDGLSVINNGSFGGNLTVGGVLTYEDVTNVDSVGLITARNGIVVGSGITVSKDGDIFATGITTISENLKVGTGVTISLDGDGFYTGVVTATTFSGSLAASNLTGALPTISGANLTGVDVVDDTSPQLGGNLDTNSNNIKFGDSAGTGSNRIRMGASNDLEIYHNGNHSYIEESGTGNLYIRSSNTRMQSSTGEDQVLMAEDGAVELYHDASKKFETTSSGVTVTGTVTDSNGNLRSIPLQNETGAHVLNANGAGRVIYISTGGVTVNPSVMSGGDAVTIINNSGSDQTITQGSSMTLYFAADATTGNRTLAGRGMATIWFADHNIAYISGAGLS